MEKVQDTYRQLPGVIVMQHSHDEGRKHGLEFTLRKGEMFEAATPYRNCVYAGDTPAEAIGCLLLGVAELSRNGSIDPSRPNLSGSPPIQHAIHLLTERLLWQVELRREHLVEYGSPLGAGPAYHVEDDTVKAIARDNEIISALGTSIAALARVKDL